MEQLLRGCYLLLIVWQAAWLGYLPEPAGPELGWLGLAVAAPLCLSLKGIWRADPKGINWASYLLIPYFLFGVTEAWSNATQRSAALLQLALVCTCLVLIGIINHRLTRAARAR